MVSFTNTLLALAAAVAVSADYYIVPDTVDINIRRNWCQNELSTCPLICQQVSAGKTIVNTCDAVTLTYGCVCANQLQPNVSEYSLTLPFFTCQEYGNQCVKGCGSDNACSSACRQDHPCGALDPRTNYTTTSESSMTSTAGPTTTANQVFDGIPGATTTAAAAAAAATGGNTSKNAGAALKVGSAYGLVMVAGGLFAGFAMML